MTDEITQNDCQAEDPFMAYYSKLSALETKLFKAIGIAFQLKDFGHNVIDEIDGECFEQDVEQMDRFTAANKAALAAAMEIVNPELARLNAELTEAREIIGESCEVFDMLSNELIPEIASLLESMGLPDHANRVRAAMVYSNDDLPRRARAFLKGETE